MFNFSGIRTEVQHLDGPVLTHLYVGGLQVPMDHPRLVRRLQCLGDLLRNGERLIERDRPLSDPVSQSRPLDQLQDERPRPLGFLDAVDGGDVGVVEAGEDLRSRVNRARRSGSAAKASGRIFRATSRLSCVSVACQTWPMPPSPSRVVTS